jgi:formamidopyrimidine-DNA glycosylase
MIVRAARCLSAALEGETVAASAPNPRGREAAASSGVESHGKNLLLHFGDLILHSHLGMSGSWHVYPPLAAGASRGARPGRCWQGREGQEAVQFDSPTLRILPARQRSPRSPTFPPRPQLRHRGCRSGV